MFANGPFVARIHCSQPCKEKLDILGGYHFEEKGVTQVKVRPFKWPAVRTQF